MKKIVGFIFLIALNVNFHAMAEKRISVLTVYFATGSSEISSVEKQRIENWIQFSLQQKKDVILLLQGYADERGDAQYNLDLGDLRAHQVKEVFLKEGVDEKKMITVTYGEEKKVSLENLDENRCVEIVLLKRTQSNK